MEVTETYSFTLFRIEQCVGEDITCIFIYYLQSLPMVSSLQIFRPLHTLFNLYSVFVPQPLKCLSICHLLMLHKEGNGIALLMTAKAVEVLS